MKRAPRKASSKREALLCKKAARQQDYDGFRTTFQHDQDEIIFSMPFKRLAHKTQLLASPPSAHYRTRLTHSLEVMQIAEHMARALFLNIDLADAIALGHDIGHAPFGHVGEAALSTEFERLRNGKWKHEIQSERILKKELKAVSSLCIDGARWHREDSLHTPCSLEGQVVGFADQFAYLNHDIEDAKEAKLELEDGLTVEGVLKQTGKVKVAYRDTYTKIFALPEGYPELLHPDQKIRIATFERLTVEHNRKTFGDVLDERGEPCLMLPPTLVAVVGHMKNIILSKIRRHPDVLNRDREAQKIVLAVLSFARQYPENSGFLNWLKQLCQRRSKKMNDYYDRRKKRVRKDSLLFDYVASMTDRGVLEIYRSFIYPEFQRHNHVAE